MPSVSLVPHALPSPGDSPPPASRPRQQLGSACEECRRKKSRCDRKQPTCGACFNGGIVCVMRSSCPPRGPKKGHMRELRGQIAALEARLNNHESGAAMRTSPNFDQSQRGSSTDTGANDEIRSDGDVDVRMSTSTSPPKSTMTPGLADMTVLTDPDTQQMSLLPMTNVYGSFTTQPLKPLSIGANLSPLVCTDLDQLYFDRVHQFCPMIQKFRYMPWSKLIGRSKQKICLQHAMWTMAAATSSQFQLIRDQLYRETRQLLDALDMDNLEGGKWHLEQVQAWALLSIYELTAGDTQRGLISAGRAFRLAQLMKLHEVDRPNAANGMSDWVEVETMRRTFWVLYTIDCFTSINEGLPLTFDEQVICARLPAPEGHFMSGRSITMPFLSKVMETADSTSLDEDTNMSSFADSVIVATICGRTLMHRQRANQGQPCSEKFVHEFSQRHQLLDRLLSAQVKRLAVQVSSMSQNPDPMLIFIMMNAYMTVLMLYETVNAVTTEASRPLLLEYKQQSLEAARELGGLATMLTQLNHFQIHPLSPIPLLLSARCCQAHRNVCTTYDTLMSMIQPLLQGLGNVNNLARNGLRVLGLEPLPGSNGWPSPRAHWDGMGWDDSTM
ncbi:hypothetical protein S40293_04088 [Stachybotrys chartarum IBT 40293]|nr:hypothetical protein S40293_04088 [Stachybotrys chartarum IBT 40293]